MVWTGERGEGEMDVRDSVAGIGSSTSDGTTTREGRAMWRRHGRRFGRLLITTTRQAGGHPWFDQAVSDDDDGNRYRCRAIRPSLRRQFDRNGGTALVIGWRA